MVQWKALVKRIPHKVQIKAKAIYEVLYTPLIHKAEDCYGVTRPDTKQILLDAGMKPKNMTSTYLHEVVHAFSIEHDIGLTETQVRKIEKALPYLLKANNLFKEE